MSSSKKTSICVAVGMAKDKPVVSVLLTEKSEQGNGSTSATNSPVNKKKRMRKKYRLNLNLKTKDSKSIHMRMTEIGTQKSTSEEEYGTGSETVNYLRKQCQQKSTKKKRSNKRFGRTTRGRRRQLHKHDYLNDVYYQNNDPPKGTILSIDIEKCRDKRDNTLVAGWIAVVSNLYPQKVRKYGLKSSCIFHCKIKLDVKKYDLMTKWSGITESMISNGISINEAALIIEHYLKNYTMIGVSIRDDLQCLGLQRYAYSKNVVDIQEIFYGQNGPGDKIGLKTLAYSIKNRLIQEYTEGSNIGHNPIIDAQVAINLYMRYIKSYVKPKIDVTGYESFQWTREKEEENDDIRNIKERIRYEKMINKRNAYILFE